MSACRATCPAGERPSLRRLCVQTAATLLIYVAWPTGCTSQNPLEQPPREHSTLIVDGRVALASLTALGDGYLRATADHLQLLARSGDARGEDWYHIQQSLQQLSTMKLPADWWLALPDGTYWSTATEPTDQPPGSPTDAAAGTLTGDGVIRTLAVSDEAGKNLAVLRVPILRNNGSLAGTLGASIRLRDLSERLRSDLQLEDHMIFYAFDDASTVALAWDPDLLVTQPAEEDDELRQVLSRMLSHEQGILRYTYRDRSKTVLYRQSAETDWWYALGVIHLD